MPASTLASGETPLPRVAVVRGARHVATGAALLACACVLGLVESSLPPILPAPWLRLGLANVAVVAALALAGWRTALAVGLGRVLIVGLATGTLAGPLTLMAGAGALASVAAMGALASFGTRYSIVGWSAVGSVAHVLAQFAVAAALLHSSALLFLVPPSVLAALALGAGVGLLTRTAVSRLPSR